MPIVDNPFEPHLRHVLPHLSEDKIKLVMALQDKCAHRMLEVRGSADKINEVAKEIFGEIRRVLGEQDFRTLFGDWEAVRLVNPKEFKPL